MSGTDLGYSDPLRAYGLATRCPVLTWRMALPDQLKSISTREDFVNRGCAAWLRNQTHSAPAPVQSVPGARRLCI
eukprot:3941262-Rhodomonas_salina.4